jgi:hypothetical protein
MCEKNEPTGLARLICPLVASILAAYFYGHQRGWVVGITSGVLMFAFAIGIWRRQIIKYPDGTWKGRL